MIVAVQFLVVYTVDEIEVIIKDTVVELFGVDAQSSFIWDS